MPDPATSNARDAGAPTRRRAFFGLLEHVATAGDQDAAAIRYDYIGPRSPLLLTLAIVFGGRRRRDGDYDPVHVDGKPCRFSWRGGLAGPGLVALSRQAGARPTARAAVNAA